MYVKLKKKHETKHRLYCQASESFECDETYRIEMNECAQRRRETNRATCVRVRFHCCWKCRCHIFHLYLSLLSSVDCWGEVKLVYLLYASVTILTCVRVYE